MRKFALSQAHSVAKSDCDASFSPSPLLTVLAGLCFPASPADRAEAPGASIGLSAARNATSAALEAAVIPQAAGESLPSRYKVVATVSVVVAPLAGTAIACSSTWT